jgi:predicted MPP superfamily phosphohydrolase
VYGLLPTPTTGWFTVIAVAAAIAGIAALWRRPGRWGIAGDVGLAIITATLVTGTGAVLLATQGLDIFGVTHLAYLGVVVTLPLLGLALAVRTLTSSTDGRPVAGAVAAALLVPGVVGWYGTHVEPRRLQVEQVAVAVDGDRDGDDPVRIGVLTDLQTDDPGTYEDDAVDRLLAEQPDLILLPGDLFQGSVAAFDDHEADMRALLRRLDAPHGVYLVRGDVDVGDRADRLVAGSDIVVLDDESVDVTVGDRRLRIGGNRLRYWSPEAAALRQELDGAPEDGTIRVLLAHRPDAALDLPRGSRVDLVVAGHTHGGQIVVPGLGPLFTASEVPRSVAAGGLHEIAGNPIYVGTGVGMERGQAPQVRLFARPTIGVVELR